MEQIKAFTKCAKTASDSDRYDILGQFLDGFTEEWDTIINSKYIHLEDAIQWIQGGTLSNTQLRSKYLRTSKSIKELNDPIFEEGIHWVEYTPSESDKSNIYLTIEGFTYWSMGQTTPRSNLVRSYISRRYVRLSLKTESNNTPIKKRKRESVIVTPVRKKRFIVNKIEHPSIDTLQEILRSDIKNKSQVYFIWDGTYMKIGITTRGSHKRIKELQTGSSRDLTIFKRINVEHPLKLEKELHKKYKKQRVRGEWFNISKNDVLGLLKSF